jgi:hypothetical protein
MPVRINRPLLLCVLVLCCVGIATLAALWNWSLSSKFGRVAISLPNGSTIYAVRESWGLSSEQLSITRNPDGCVPADPANDYVLKNPADTSVLYRVAADGLTIYDLPFNRVVDEPTHPWPNIKVTMSRTKDPLYDDVRADPEKYGATLTKIPLNEPCWRNIFRRSNSLR